MNNYLLLIGISCVPAVTGMCITLPLWLLRHLRNQTIHTLGLTVLFLTLASCLLPVITGENSGTGFAAIALSCINFSYSGTTNVCSTPCAARVAATRHSASAQ